MPASAGGVKGTRPPAVADAIRAPSSSRAIRLLRDACRIALGKDLCLTYGPLHTRAARAALASIRGTPNWDDAARIPGPCAVLEWP